MKKGPERGLRAFIGVVIRGLFVTSRSDVPTFRVDGQGGLPDDYAVGGGAVHGLAFGDAEGLEEGIDVAEGDVDAMRTYYRSRGEYLPRDNHSISSGGFFAVM